MQLSHHKANEQNYLLKQFKLHYIDKEIITLS